jgi:hypothetical protein
MNILKWSLIYYIVSINLSNIYSKILINDNENKEKCANENGYSLIRLLQKDVFFDNYEWLDEIVEKINEIKNVNKVKNYYLCKNNEYINYLNN